MARQKARKTTRKTTRKKTRRTAKPKARKKATKRTTARKTPAKRKTTAKRKVTRARRAPARPKARQAISFAMPGGQIGRMGHDVAREMKKMVNKYLKLAMKHAKYYGDTKYWTKRSMYKLMRMGKELEATQKQYLKMAQQYLRRMMQ
jgi:hypothetical protein